MDSKAPTDGKETGKNKDKVTVRDLQSCCEPDLLAPTVGSMPCSSKSVQSFIYAR